MVDVRGLEYVPHDLRLPSGDLWVFGYGSLIWNPGFAYLERREAQIHGFHRALCVLSWVHRGTPARPGLVMGLDLGGSCRGIAYRVAAADKDAVADYLYRREMATPVYLPTLKRLRLGATETHRPLALTFTVDRGHPQYGGRLSIAEALSIVRGAAGRSGQNPEYVLSAVRHLRELAIRDRWLEDLAGALDPVVAAAGD